MTTERRRVVYSGRVQGVGFRMTARRLSSGFSIIGYVRNREDGQVEMVVEGDPEIVANYLRMVHREFGDMIRDIHEQIEPSGSESLAGFTIRY